MTHGGPFLSQACPQTLQRFDEVNIVAGLAVVNTAKTYPLFINGEIVAPQASATLDVLDPSSAEVIARVPDASAADVDRAVKAARTAFDESLWKDATAQDRGRILLKLANLVRDRADELAEL